MLKNPSGITKIVSQIKISILSKLDAEIWRVVPDTISFRQVLDKVDGRNFKRMNDLIIIINLSLFNTKF